MPDQTNKPLRDKEEISRHPDPKIDQDFEGYPHGPATDKTIKPRTEAEEKTAGTGIKDGEKDEQESDGSANAFEGK